MLLKGEIENLKDIIIKKCDQYKDRVAFLQKDKETNEFKEITYQMLKDDVIAIATALISKYNLKGEKIAVIGENSYNWYASYMAVTTGVGVIVPLDKELPENEIENLVKRSNVGAIIFSSKKKETVFGAKEKLKKDIIYIDMDKDKSDDESYALKDIIAEGKNLIDKGDKSYFESRIDKNEFRVLLFTSGTTAKSKGVMLSHANIVANLEGATDLMSLKKTDVFFSVLPIHHIYEMIATYMLGISNGTTIAINNNLKQMANDLKVAKPTILVTVPVLLDFILNRIQKEIKVQKKEKLIEKIVKITNKMGPLGKPVKRKLFKKIHASLGGRIRYIMVSAAPVKKETIENIEKFGYIIFQGYGLSETAPLVSATRIKTRKAGTVGQASNCEVKIYNPDENQIGEIIVKGPNVMLGYYEDTEATNQVIIDGWFHTGDLGKFDEEGHLMITGRSKNVIVTSNGKNIFPEEIEEELNKLDIIKESLVYGKKTEKDMVVSASVTLNEDYIKDTYGQDRPDDQKIYETIWLYIKELNKKMVSYKAIKKLTIRLNDFEKTTTMKIKRFLDSNKD